MVFRYILICLFCVLPIYCNDIEDLISQIKSAPVEDKRELINQLKNKLKSINKIEREKTISKLKTLKNNKIRYYNSYNVLKIHQNSLKNNQKNYKRGGMKR